MTALSTDLLLSAKNLTKHFGGLAAVNNVSIDLYRGQIHAVIGPNGAGKSTLTNLVSGDLALTSGSIHLNGLDVTGWRAEKISKQGLGRSFQKTNVFLPLSVWDNVRLAAQSRDSHQPWNPLVWFKNAHNATNLVATKTVNMSAEAIIALCKLENRMHAIAGTISHGEQRQLEIAMTLATQPKVLLLDEPLAGMGVAEAERMIELLHTLKKDHAMLLVEHDMDAVFALADKLTVMVNGQVIASDSPGNVRADAKVQAAYLGEEEHV
jgi:branched-chain amino acid transport system ATP-binding protein